MKLKLEGLRQRYQAVTKIMRGEVLQRKAAEKKLVLSKRHYTQLLKQSRLMQESLRRLSRQIILAQEDERKEISRELHDEVGQVLSGINLHLATLKIESAVNSSDFKNKITRTQKLVEKSVNIVHRFARDLRPTLLDDLGLIPALQSYIKSFTKRTGLHVRFTAFAGVERLSSVKRTVLYRVAQAALMNVAQHAKASTVKVELQKKQHALWMEVKDNGKSFQVERVLFAKNNKHLGLLGMRERVEMVNGHFKVESVKGVGTAIRAEIPFDKSEEKLRHE